jgi:hypothetical protein
MPAAPLARRRKLENDVAHGLTVSPPNRDKLTMRVKPLKTRDLILSLSKDGTKIPYFFSGLLDLVASPRVVFVKMASDNRVSANHLLRRKRHAIAPFAVRGASAPA